MKKTATVLIMLAALLFMTDGIAQIQLGLQAGANFGNVTMDPEQEGIELGTRTGFLIGGILFYSFSPILGLQVEPAYVQKGSKVDISIFNIKQEATLTANYIDIPVLLKASFGDGPVKPYLIAGATVAFKLGEAILEFSDDTEDTLKTKSTDFLLNLGGGVLIPLGQVNIFIEGQYNLGLTDVNDDPDDDTKIKTTGIQIKAGVMFPLN